jgi:hypothetical protein
MAATSTVTWDRSPDKLTRLGERIQLRAAEIARETKTSVAFVPSSHSAPASAAVEVQQAIERSAGRLGLATARMPSGAGHDAQMMARLSPMGMIFVPSVRGISHSPLELTRWDDCARGADVLLGAVLDMDRGAEAPRSIFPGRRRSGAARPKSESGSSRHWQAFRRPSISHTRKTTTRSRGARLEPSSRAPRLSGRRSAGES